MKDLILKGKPVRARLTEQLKYRCNALRMQGITPHLAVFRMGEKADDLSYERSLLSYMTEIGVEVTVSALPVNELKTFVERTFSEVCMDDNIDGVLPLMPLAPSCGDLLQFLPAEKDVDGLLGKMSCFSPCTPEAALVFADHYHLLSSDVVVAVLGRSALVGAPLARLLRERHYDVRVVHSQTADPFSVVRSADVIFSAVGKPRFLDARYLREGQVVIDIGVSADEAGGLCGDLDTNAAKRLDLRYSSVPGGVGGVTTAILAQHILESCEKRRCPNGQISVETERPS